MSLAPHLRLFAVPLLLLSPMWGCGKKSEPTAADTPGTAVPSPQTAPSAVAVAPAKEGPVQLPASGERRSAEAAEYLVSVEAPASVSSGAAGAFQVHLTPRAGWKLNREFPTKLSMRAAGGTLSAGSLGVEQAATFDEKKGATWQMSFNAGTEATATFVGTFKFAVCTDTVCDPKREELAFTVPVAPPGK